MVRVQRIIVPDTQERSWGLFDANHKPLIAPNQYLSYLHHLGRSPNTVRAYAHHLQAFSKFLFEGGWDWTALSLTELAKFVTWLRRVGAAGSKSRSDTTINTILAAVGSFYEYQDRLGVATKHRPVAAVRSKKKQRGMYRQGTTFRMNREQRPCVTSRDSHYISTLRQVHSILESAYDDRPEHEKDVWELQRMAVPISLSLSNATLSFHRIRQPWLRKAVKAYIRYCLPMYSEGTCRARLQSLTCFSDFLMQRATKWHCQGNHTQAADRISKLPTQAGLHLGS